MKSRLSEDFKACFSKLPAEVQENARKSFRIWRQDPHHPGLRFKRIHRVDPVYSVRVGRHWRAVGLLEDDTITWFWIGSHSEYNHLIRK